MTAKPKIKPLNSYKPVLLQQDFISLNFKKKKKKSKTPPPIHTYTLNSTGQYSNFLKKMSDEDSSKLQTACKGSVIMAPNKAAKQYRTKL